jgi:hypothetical protein
MGFILSTDSILGKIVEKNSDNVRYYQNLTTIERSELANSICALKSLIDIDPEAIQNAAIADGTIQYLQKFMKNSHKWLQEIDSANDKTNLYSPNESYNHMYHIVLMGIRVNELVKDNIDLK